MAGEEKTEKATPKKRRDMREKEGMVLQSNEVMIAVSVVAMFVGLRMLGTYMLNSLGDVFKEYIGSLGDQVVFDAAFVQKNALNIVKYGVLIV